MAEKSCKDCKAEIKGMPPVPYVVHEDAMARAERQTKSLVWLIVLLIVLLVGTNAGWLWHESQFEVVEETIAEYTIEQDAESGNNNSIINGGEVINGEANN
jgi:hypothetical protein